MICNLSYNVTNNKITYLMRQSKTFQQNRWKQKIISFFFLILQVLLLQLTQMVYLEEKFNDVAGSGDNQKTIFYCTC